METPHVAVDPKELNRARHGWSTFTRMAKYGVLAMACLLILMALFLL